MLAYYGSYDTSISCCVLSTAVSRPSICTTCFTVMDHIKSLLINQTITSRESAMPVSWKRNAQTRRVNAQTQTNNYRTALSR